MAPEVLKLSPSRAVEFKNCPQRYKFRVVDGLREPASEATARGSLVHAVLERLFSERAEMRTPERAELLLESLWTQARDDPELAAVTLGDERAWLAEGRRLLRNLFVLEDPRRLPAARLEWRVEYEIADLRLRGIIDRLELGHDGQWVLTDYKTGRVPGGQRELQAFFGLRFYALVCWRAFGVMPREMRLVYLSDPAVLTLHPQPRMLEAFERQMRALGRAIRRAYETGDWRPRPSPLCMSCAWQDACPSWSRTTVDPG